MIRLEQLTGGHDRNGFDCGVAALDTWLRHTALQHQAKGISRTVVAVPEAQGVADEWLDAGFQGITVASILGFYALSSALVVIEDLPQQTSRRYPKRIPVTRLGRLAVRSDVQSQGLGRFLLADAIMRARQAALRVGSAGIVVDTKSAAAAQFYQRYGFVACAGQSRKLFLAMW
ncbi:GNAT family N-acetyltransferase [Candidimonas nitroreducens]|uniref:GNAT family N-acetyltransferase n=1 Tax=Candidimonas nitroreducens TaxID=683354 RepID=A0A225MWV5_9BURK|nr:GNAT family N-acetyltransferase [Candidimonas nitroreducens]OWT64061.1 GNAT family N-acetyltransferase [Candidimonas nitroreducens]